MDKSQEEALAVLVAKDQIRSAILRYFRGVDRSDTELMKSAFHSDAEAFKQNAWQFVEHFIPENDRDTTFTLHHMGNFNVEVDGDSARSEAYFVCYIGRDEDRQSYIDMFCGRYIHRWEKRHGVWAAVMQDTIREWARNDAIRGQGFEVPETEAGAHERPVRNRADLSYFGRS